MEFNERAELVKLIKDGICTDATKLYKCLNQIAIFETQYESDKLEEKVILNQIHNLADSINKYTASLLATIEPMQTIHKPKTAAQRGMECYDYVMALQSRRDIAAEKLRQEALANLTIKAEHWPSEPTN